MPVSFETILFCCGLMWFFLLFLVLYIFIKDHIEKKKKGELNE